MAKPKKATTNELAVSEQFNDTQVSTALEQINLKLKELKEGDENLNLINEPLGVFGRIQDIEDPQLLRGAYAYISKKGEAVDSYSHVFQKAVPAIKIGVFKENGYTVSQWQEVILAQYRKTTRKAEIEKMEKIKSKMEKLLSEEAKKQQEFKELQDLLNS